LNGFEAKPGYNQQSMPAKSWLITGVGLVGKALNKVIYNYPISDTMSTRYKFIDNNAVYLTTSTVVGWTDIFTREMYKTILLDCVRHCQQSQGLKIHAWVLMTNPARMTGRTGTCIPFAVVKVGSITTNTIYVRDASGNIITVYTKNAAINSGSLTQTEISMYGSSRLGVWNPNRNVATLAAIDYAAYSSTFIRGNKGFELTNHLGNVLVTVSDKKIGVDAAPADGIIDYYTADVVTANDYYPGGMLMPGRKFIQAGASPYRYSINGQEKDLELNENITTAEYWEYDSRIGRRWNTDVVSKPFVSDYATFGNNPIYFIDPNGADWYKNKTSGNVEYKANWHKKHKGYESLGKGNGNWLNHEGKDYNKKTGEVSTTLETVTVTATKKTSLADRTGALNWANNTGPSSVWREDYWNYKHDGNQTGLDAGRIAMYDRWIQTELDWKAMSLGEVGIMAAPLLLETGLVVGTEAFLWKMGLDGVGQTVANGGDLSKFDVFDMTLAGFSAPGASALYGGAVDIKLNGEFNVVGFNKPWQTAAMDGAFKFAFGGRGLNGVPNNMLKKLTFSTPLTTIERNIWLRCMSTPINLSGKVLRKEVKQKTGL